MRFPAFLVEQNEFRTINCLKRCKTHLFMKRIFQFSLEKCCETVFIPVFEENGAKRIDHSNAFSDIHMEKCRETEFISISRKAT